MKIGITGTMSVGKTTLVEALKNHPKFKDYNFFTERTKFLKSHNVPTDKNSTLEGQLVFLGERAGELLHENMITDRTVIDVASFTFSSPLIENKDKNNFLNLTDKLVFSYDYIFYVSPEGIEIEDNGIRDINENFRNEINDNILDYISFLHKAYKDLPIITSISGTTEERIKQIIETIENNQKK